MTSKRLGALLLSIGLIDDKQLKQALEIHKETKDRLGNVLIKQNFITESQLIEALKLQLGIDSIALSVTSIQPEMAQVLPKTIARKYGVVPVKISKDTLYLAMTDPLNFLWPAGGQVGHA
jgi:type IV pilus assembly protein PilB